VGGWLQFFEFLFSICILSLSLSLSVPLYITFVLCLHIFRIYLVFILLLASFLFARREFICGLRLFGILHLHLDQTHKIHKTWTWTWSWPRRTVKSVVSAKSCKKYTKKQLNINTWTHALYIIIYHGRLLWLSFYLWFSFMFGNNFLLIQNIIAL